VTGLIPKLPAKRNVSVYVKSLYAKSTPISTTMTGIYNALANADVTQSFIEVNFYFKTKHSRSVDRRVLLG
jgi:hypothetical protein